MERALISQARGIYSVCMVPHYSSNGIISSLENPLIRVSRRTSKTTARPFPWNLSSLWSISARSFARTHCFFHRLVECFFNQILFDNSYKYLFKKCIDHTNKNSSSKRFGSHKMDKKTFQLDQSVSREKSLTWEKLFVHYIFFNILINAFTRKFLTNPLRRSSPTLSFIINSYISNKNAILN